MTNYEVTEKDFKDIINWKKMINSSGCKAKPRAGTHKETDGHNDCSSCPGNYYNGGWCNYGGCHVLSEEIAQINKNFSGIDKLEERHLELRLSTEASEEDFKQKKANLLNDFNLVKNNCSDPAKFIYATCVGVEGAGLVFQDYVKQNFQDFAKAIERYISQVENATWYQVQEFQKKLKEIENFKQENNKLLEEFKDPDTLPSRKAQIEEIIRDNKSHISQLHQELNQSPIRSLFDPETESILRHAKRALFQRTASDPYINLGKSQGDIDWDSLKRKEKARNKNTRKQNQQGNSWSPQTKENLKNTGWFLVFVSVLSIAYWWIKSKIKGE